MAISVQFQLGEIACAVQQDGPATAEFAETLLRIAAERGIATHRELVDADEASEGELDDEAVRAIMKAVASVEEDTED